MSGEKSSVHDPLVPGGAKKGGGQRRCGFCGEVGHYKTTCPKRINVVSSKKVHYVYEISLFREKARLVLGILLIASGVSIVLYGMSINDQGSSSIASVAVGGLFGAGGIGMIVTFFFHPENDNKNMDRLNHIDNDTNNDNDV